MITAALLTALASPPQAPAAAPAVTALVLARASEPPVIDGRLTEPVWTAATLVDTFYETAFADNRTPVVQTFGYLLYDERYLYIGFRCADPDTSKIRAPYSDRDLVSTADDSVTVMVDARNDRRTAQLFRVNPRGVQTDGLFFDASGAEDFSADFFFDSVSQLTTEGWEVEMRIPLSSLRYNREGRQAWGLILRRNYPRDRRYSIYSTPIPRGFNCIVCHSQELGGLTNLPSANQIVIAPYVSGTSIATAPRPGAPLGASREDGTAGIDVKWKIGSNTALDATIRPDFSQVEGDVAQIAANNRFALFFPEKRPFFLEGYDLFSTPIQAVYSRTITSPRWGARATGQVGSATYTVLGAEDRGGGLVVIPGPESSSFAPQDFRSTVGVVRVRQNLGSSYVGAVGTGRAIEGGGYNVVAGPDFQLRRGPNRLTGQFLYSNTETPFKPDLAPEWDSRGFQSHAAEVQWETTHQRWGATLRYRDFGDDFRADTGFVPQVGYRQGYGEFGLSFYNLGFFSIVNPGAIAEITKDRDGRTSSQRLFPGIQLLGKKNLSVLLGAEIDKVRSGGVLFDRQQFTYTLQVDPSRRLPRFTLSGFVGEEVDFFNTRLGQGASVSARMILRPTDHLNLELVSSRDWLNVATTLSDDRLFTAQVQRAKVTYNIDRRAFVRLIGQWVETQRNPGLYIVPVERRSGDLEGSVLFGYRLDWQSALFIGYGDNRALDEGEDLQRVDRQFFVKLSYAWQR